MEGGDVASAPLRPYGVEVGALLSVAAGVGGGAGLVQVPVAVGVFQQPLAALPVDDACRFEFRGEFIDIQPEALGHLRHGEGAGGEKGLLIVRHLGCRLLQLCRLQGDGVSPLFEGGRLLGVHLFQPLPFAALLLECLQQPDACCGVCNDGVDGGLGGGHAVAQEFLDAVVAPDGKLRAEPAGELQGHVFVHPCARIVAALRNSH